MIYTAITQGVRVSVESRYEVHHSDPDKLSNVYSYHVLIENVGSSPVQLLRRHWYIVDSLHGLSEVQGDGVIGEQPLLEPGFFHEYESWCSLRSEVGKMWGTYLFLNCVNNKNFRVKIPEFQLIVPYKLS